VELQRELEKIKRERAEKREQEVRTSFHHEMSHIANWDDAGTREGGSRGGCPRARHCSWQSLTEPKIRLQYQAQVQCYTISATTFTD
jgi:hypothetical protein